MDKKKIIIIITVVVLLVLGIGFLLLRRSSLEKTLEEVQAYTSYELICNMEMLENDELRSYQVTSTYALIDDSDYYKVELYDKSLNQSQIIVKNSDGVFVLTPTLNQAFQFKSEWPNNTPKPYIYQSLLDFLSNNEVTKESDGYQVIGEITYENDSRVTSQEVLFDKQLKPISVSVYDGDGVEIIKVEVTSFEANIALSVDDFDEETLLTTTTNTYSSVSSSLPLYPVSLMGSVLETEQISTIDDLTNHILKFTGEKNFTIVESSLSESEDINVTYINSDVIDLIDGIAYFEDNQLTYIASGIVCSIYSNDLSNDEMLAVLSSMQSSTIK
ncbi:MAG: hypothetical protein LUH02_10360 [Erysipelotrichaceae bacterium]|nr:hypothetical protein [Erysipelotrichaceae bacterium]